MIKAIETRYKGYRFRSRLEARWAVFFDALGVEWEYEKEGYDLGELGYYLPDFWIPIKQFHDQYKNPGYFIEIKGETAEERALDKLKILSNLTKHSCRMFIGLPGEQSSFWCHHTGNCGWRNTPAYPKEPPWKVAPDSVFQLQCIAILTGVPNGMGRIMKCASKAKSARFEHGEHP